MQIRRVLLEIVHRELRFERTQSTKTNAIKHCIPSSKGWPVIGNLLSFMRAGGAPMLHRYIDAKHRVLGGIFNEKLGNVNAVFISDPEMMRAVFAQEGRHPVHVLPEAWTVYNQMYGCARGLFFMDGAEWLHNRRIMNNFLFVMKQQNSTSRRTGGNGDFIKDAVEFTASQFDVQQCERDLETTLYRWSLDTIVAILLGRDAYAERQSAIDSRSDEVSRKIKLIFETSARLQFVPVQLAHTLRLRVWRDFVRSVDDALDTASDLVYDLLAPLNSNGSGLLSLMLGAEMAKSDIIKIVVDLVLAAGDTTAYTMQWALYLLAKHERVQIAQATVGDVKNIVRETLRLYPVAPFLTRINTEQDICLKDYWIPKNTLLIYSLYTAGRDAEVFAQPEDFLPERWRTKTPPMMQASLPFAMGARSCIGRRIAELQLTTTLQGVLDGYSIRLERPNDEVEMILKMISVPSKPIKLKFIKK